MASKDQDGRTQLSTITLILTCLLCVQVLDFIINLVRFLKFSGYLSQLGILLYKKVFLYRNHKKSFENIRTDVNILNWDFSYSERIMVGIFNQKRENRYSDATGMVPQSEFDYLTTNLETTLGHFYSFCISNMYKLILINSWCLFMKKGAKDCINSVCSPSVGTSASSMNFAEGVTKKPVRTIPRTCHCQSVCKRAFIHVQRRTNLCKFVP